MNPLTNKLVSLVKLELPSKIHYQDIIWKEILGAIGWHLLDNFCKTLLEITYFKVIFKLRLLISNLASIYRLALIPVRLIMEGVLDQFWPQESELQSKLGSGQYLMSYRYISQRSKYYIRSNFQNWKFVNLIADSKSLEKTMIRKCLSFLKYLSGT